jgi:hypothetical protein
MAGYLREFVEEKGREDSLSAFASQLRVRSREVNRNFISGIKLLD